MILKDLKNLNLMEGLHKSCKTRIRRVKYTFILLGSLCLPHALLCQDKTEIKASVSGNINCINTSVRLEYNFEGKGVIDKWTGPNGYFSTVRNPETAIPGNYTVSIIDPVTGITLKDSVTISMDTIPPRKVIAASSGILTCNNTLITLSGSSTTPGVEYQWKGPEGFSSSQKDPVIAVPGIYKLTVTNPVNGCTTETNITATQNIKPPEDVVATASGILTCNIQKVKITGTSSTEGVIYNWKGRDLNTQSRIQNVTTPGEYLLEVTDTANGCSSKASVRVEQNITPPVNVVVTVSDTITCKTDKAKLEASSGTGKSKFQWSGPEGITSSDYTLMTGIPGNYTLLASNPENGCSTSKTVRVIKDISIPENIKVTSSGVITCNDDSVTLTCTSSVKDVTYNWTGPDEFLSVVSSPKVTKKGKYHVEIAKTSNGCFVTKSILVTENKSLPEGVSAIPSGSISCETPCVKLIGESSTGKTNFVWTGPDGFRSDLKEPTVILPGKYTLSVINPENGCKSETSVKVAGEVCKENQ